MLVIYQLMNCWAKEQSFLLFVPYFCFKLFTLTQSLCFLTYKILFQLRNLLLTGHQREWLSLTTWIWSIHHLTHLCWRTLTSTLNQDTRYVSITSSYKTKLIFTSPGTNLNYPIHAHATCSSSDFIYLLTCTQCDAFYVGETKNSLSTRPPVLLQ